MVFGAGYRIVEETFCLNHKIPPYEKQEVKNLGIDLDIKFVWTVDINRDIYCRFIFKSQNDLNLYRLLDRVKENNKIEFIVRRKWYQRIFNKIYEY